ncbi:MAG: hypothetical protein ACHQ6U_00255 [Thermodesulfobacteriota bacterium]
MEDILNEIEVLRSLKGGDSVEPMEDIIASLSDKEKAVYSALGVEPVHVYEIIKLTGLEVSNILSLLLSLELNGFISQHPGKLFRRRVRLRLSLTLV